MAMESDPVPSAHLKCGGPCDRTLLFPYTVRSVEMRDESIPKLWNEEYLVKMYLQKNSIIIYSGG